MGEMWRIGELAQRAGTTPKTIRYYESLRLLPPPRRAASGHRRYGEADLQRLAFIRRAQSLGLSLAEIREILVLRRQGIAPCSHVVDLLNDHLAAIEQRLRELEALRRELADLRARAMDGSAVERGSEAICCLIEQGTSRSILTVRDRGALLPVRRRSDEQEPSPR